MSSHSLAEAQADLPALVERALRGEPVVITRDGAPAVELHPIRPADQRPPAPGVDEGPARRRVAERARDAGPQPVSEEGLAWLERHRVRPANPPAIDSAALVRQMRDEGW